MGQRILLIEDDASLAEFAQWQLERQKYEVKIALRGQDGLDIVDAWHPDLVILDIMMPEMDGWAIAKRIRDKSDVPLVFATALGMEKDVVRGLDLGADDYLTKPYGPRELLARVRAVLRRRGHTQDNHERVYTNGPLSLNLDTREVTVSGKPVALTPIEFNLLTLLADNEGKVLTHDVLIEQVWGSGHRGQRHYLKLYIWYLRQKIEDDPRHPKLILTERGVGYRLNKASKAQ
jgi:two-component system, OmpR family, KDP operon response regulator KdpE